MVKGRDSKYERNLIHKKFSLAGIDERGHMTRNVCDLQKLTAASGWQPARKQGSQPYNLKELDSTTTM